jgi:hypothetical protein
MLTVLTVFSALVLTLIILVPARPSRENVISMPSARSRIRSDATPNARCGLRFGQRSSDEPNTQYLQPGARHLDLEPARPSPGSFIRVEFASAPSASSARVSENLSDGKLGRGAESASTIAHWAPDAKAAGTLSAPHLSFLPGRLGGFAADCFRGSRRL